MLRGIGGVLTPILQLWALIDFEGIPHICWAADLISSRRTGASARLHSRARSSGVAKRFYEHRCRELRLLRRSRHAVRSENRAGNFTPGVASEANFKNVKGLEERNRVLIPELNCKRT